jgi:hypothetical protein
MCLRLSGLRLSFGHFEPYKGIIHELAGIAWLALKAIAKQVDGILYVCMPPFLASSFTFCCIASPLILYVFL